MGLVKGLLECAVCNLDDERSMNAQLSRALVKQYIAMKEAGYKDDDDVDDILMKDENEKLQLNVNFNKISTF